MDLDITCLAPALVLLVGAPGSGKSTWARARWPQHAVVSLDGLRMAVADDAGDMGATADATAVRALIVAARLRRGLTTVVDSTNGRLEARGPLVAAARAVGVPVVAVLFPVPLAVCQRRNAARPRPVPPAELAARWVEVDVAHRQIAGEVDHVLVVPSTG